MFFTRDVSLQDWYRTGILDREKLIYEEHLKNGTLERVYWVTYGSRDAGPADRLHKEGALHADIHILPMPWMYNMPAVGSWLYSFRSPTIHAQALKQCDIYKTNQMSGSWSAVIAKRKFNKPLIVRTGYTASIFAHKRKGHRIGALLYEKAEKTAYAHAESGAVASAADKRFIVDSYGTAEERIKVLPNYIDTELFKPLPGPKFEDRIVFVGKFRKQKNLFNLISAAAITGMKLDLYGDGSQREELKRHAQQCGAEAIFHGMVPNADLPAILNKYTYYALPSLYEGTPKTLLEAMACGLVCIGAEVEGIREILRHGENGYCARDTSAEAVAKAVTAARVGDAACIGKKAQETIVQGFSLQAVAAMEAQLFQETLGRFKDQG